MAAYLDQSLAKLKEFEGCFPWMHRDSAGRVMVGLGLVLPAVDAALALPFHVHGRAATPTEITAEFKRVLQLPSMREPEFYRNPDSPELPQELIDAGLRSALLESEAEIQTRIRCYAALPDGAKLALLDMASQLTPAGLFREYPRMLRAIETGAWAQAATESVRMADPMRNTWTRAMLLSSATADNLLVQDAGWLRRTLRGLFRALPKLFGA